MRITSRQWASESTFGIMRLRHHADTERSFPHDQHTTAECVDTLASVGCTISVQGFADRFSGSAVACLQHIFQAALQQLVVASPRAVPIVERFSAVFVQDSTVIRLPDALAAVWQGCGGNREHLTPAVKAWFAWNCVQGSWLAH